MRKSIRLLASESTRRRIAVGSAADALGVIRPGYRMVGVNYGQFSMLDLIEAIISQVGASDVIVSTWTQGRAEESRIDYLLRSGKIRSFSLLIDRSFARRFPDYAQQLINNWGTDAVRQADTHAKFCLIGNDDYRLTIRTSMNFNRNARLEQFDIDDDPEIYDFFMGVVRGGFDAVDGQSNDGDEWPEWSMDF